jgi:hypothetical protein
MLLFPWTLLRGGALGCVLGLSILSVALGEPRAVDLIATARLAEMTRAAGTSTLCTAQDTAPQCVTLLPAQQVYRRGMILSEDTAVGLCDQRSACALTAPSAQTQAIVCLHCVCEGLADCILLAQMCGDAQIWECYPNPGGGPGEIWCVCKTP